MTVLRRSETICFWQRLDLAGLERLVVTCAPESIVASGSILTVEDGGFRLDHVWTLSPDWRTRRVDIVKAGEGGEQRLSIERIADGWSVNGELRPELAGAQEPDLSVTPFCNTLPIQALFASGQRELTLDTCYVDAASMCVSPSRQTYVRLGPTRFRYLDLGTAAGFEAEIVTDETGLVLTYEHLFRRLDPL